MSESTVTTDDVEHVASLARVSLDEAELETFAEQFSEVLEYFDALDEVPQVDRDAELVNVLREDEVEDGLSQSDALANAPESEDGKFKGPRVS